MDQFKESVKKSFIAFSNDIASLEQKNSQILDKLNQVLEENNSLKNQVNNLNQENLNMKSQIQGFQIALDYIKNFNQNQQQTQNISQPQQNIVQPQIGQQIPQNQPIQEQQTQRIEQPQRKVEEFKDPYDALLAFKAKKNKREVLKKKILSMITENGIAVSELKFMFVDHYKYCSKATFYNYFKEIENKGLVNIQREGTKNFVYLKSQIESEIYNENM